MCFCTNTFAYEPHKSDDFNRERCRGSKWLDYDSWRIFVEELSFRKRLNLEYVIEKLEATGKPYIINTTINRR